MNIHIRSVERASTDHGQRIFCTFEVPTGADVPFPGQKFALGTETDLDMQPLFNYTVAELFGVLDRVTQEIKRRSGMVNG